MSSRPRIVFFDFDGVISDSFELAYGTAAQVLQEALTREEYRGFFEGNIYEEFGRTHTYKPGFGDKEYFDLYRPRILEQILFARVPEALREIHAKYPSLFIVSSSTNAVLQDYLGHHGIASYFEDIQGSDVHFKKTVKLQGILQRKGADPQDSVIVTDTLGDIREAASVGVGSIAVTWGFHDKERLLKGNPHLIVETPEHLPAAIDDYFSRERS